MSGVLRSAMLSVLLLALVPAAGRARVTMKGWYFPNPYTLSGPTSPYRSGGVDLSLAISDAGYAIAFPLTSTLTDRANKFIIEMGLPMAVGVKESGGSEFYMGSPRLGLRGTWRFRMPFAEGYTLPAAWSVGADVNIPLAMIWSAGDGYNLSIPMYVHDPVAWMPAFGLRPKAQFALGEPIFFGVFELSLLNSISKSGDYDFLVGWGFALGSQPDDLLSITLEFGGLHDVTDRLFSEDSVWGALGGKFYIGQFVTGLLIRLPFTRAFVDADPTVSFTVFVGYEQRRKEQF